MTKTLTHTAALEALLALAITPTPWRNRSELARDCEFSPSTLSNIVGGRRSFGNGALTALSEQLSSVTGLPADTFREAVTLPVLARSGDVETARIVTELRKRRESDAVWQADMLRALRMRNGD